MPGDDVFLHDLPRHDDDVFLVFDHRVLGRTQSVAQMTVRTLHRRKGHGFSHVRIFRGGTVKSGGSWLLAQSLLSGCLVWFVEFLHEQLALQFFVLYLSMRASISF